MTFDVTIGSILIVIGVASLIGRVFNVEKLFWKLEPMKEQWGQTAGSIVRFVGYVIVPILAGAAFLLVSL